MTTAKKTATVYVVDDAVAPLREIRARSRKTGSPGRGAS